MKILLDHQTPFSLAKGGVTNIVHRTKAVLLSSGLDVDFLRWWDPKQQGDVYSHFGRGPMNLVTFAKCAGLVVVAEHVITEFAPKFIKWDLYNFCPTRATAFGCF
jgi:hypothetical protein